MTRIAVFLWLGVSLTLFSILASSNALPFYPSVYTNTKNKDFLVEIEDSDAVLDMLAKLGQSILKAQHEGTNSKRGLDLGLGRGFSGSQAAKHLMGLAAANFASGPGKRKRGEELKNINFRYVSPDISDIPIQDTNAEWILTNPNRQ